MVSKIEAESERECERFVNFVAGGLAAMSDGICADFQSPSCCNLFTSLGTVVVSASDKTYRVNLLLRESTIDAQGRLVNIPDEERTEWTFEMSGPAHMAAKGVISALQVIPQ